MNSVLFKSFHSLINNDNRLNNSRNLDKSDKLSYSMFVDKKAENTLKKIDSFDNFEKFKQILFINSKLK